MKHHYAALAAELLARADIQIGGERPWDLQVRDDRFYRRAIAGGAMGLGESYMDGWWDCQRLDLAFERILAADLRRQTVVSAAVAFDGLIERGPNLAYEIAGLRPLLARFQSLRAQAESHYEVGNDLYAAMLDPRMIYSCALWSDAADLPTAQTAKLAMSCAKLDLQPGMKVLDIGCGWGGFARYAAETHGVSVVGVTISANQRELALQRCAGLPIEIRLSDWREVEGRFDRIASFGMFEHVGRGAYAAFMRLARDRLAPGGRFLLETIGDDVSGRACNPWFQKYIFQAPTSMFPSIAEIARAAEGRFTVEDWHNFGPDYAPTLRAWHDNLAQREAWVIATYGERFWRMWRFYLLSCAGAFAGRTYQMWQVVLAREPSPAGFRRSA